MKVSIIIPVYNGETYIDCCLSSCINQTYNNIEIICINDGSTDNTLEHIKKFTNKYKNIVLINQNNMGVSVARNVGIQKATGKYLMFVDADDYIAETMVETLLTKLIQAHADAVKCNIDTTLKFLQHSFIEEEHFYEGKEFKDLLSQELLEDNNIFSSTWNGLYKKELCSHFPIDLRIGEDVIFNFKYFLKCSNVLLIKEKLYYYRDNQNSTTHTQNVNTILKNLEYFNSYNYVEKFLKSEKIQIDQNIFLEKSPIINYAIYIRLIFQIFNVVNIFKAASIAKKYYKLNEKTFSKISQDKIKSFLQNSYHWPIFKINTCVVPLYKGHFFSSYIGYKIIYKNLKKYYENRPY